MYLHNVSHQTTVSDNPRHHRSSTDLEQISKFLHRFYAGFVCYSFTSDKLMEKRNVLWHRNWYLKIRIMKVKIQRGRLHWFQQKHCYFKLCRALSSFDIQKLPASTHSYHSFHWTQMFFSSAHLKYFAGIKDSSQRLTHWSMCLLDSPIPSKAPKQILQVLGDTVQTDSKL